MAHAQTVEDMSPGLVKGVERAQREPAGRFHSRAPLMDVAALKRAFRRQRSDAAVGVDGVTKEDYGQNREANLEDLPARLKAKRYRHQPIRRVHLPKAPGKTRPIGISAFEDKRVQDAVRTLKRLVEGGEGRGIFEADIVSFFDSVERTELKKMLEVRVADGSLQRLIGKCLHVGVLDGETFLEPEVGTAQGSVLSPLLGNVYLHYVLDLWFATEVKPRLRGKATLLRYGDEFIIGFEREDEARRVMTVLGKRLGRFGRARHPDKTRLVPFWRPPQAQQHGKGPATLDFLGCTFYWTRTRNGHWRMWCKTRRASLRRAKQAIYDWCRRHRHLSIEDQHTALSRRLRGHCTYFGVSGNYGRLRRLVEATKRAWYKWLCRRSQRTHLHWERCTDLLRWWPLPRPRITVRLWAG